MEKRDLVDKNRIFMNKTIEKGEIVPNNAYIQVVFLCIENENKEYLIQKRTKIQNGMFGATGGHIVAGETSIKAILRETKEELGISLLENEIEYVFSKKLNNLFVDVYYIKRNINIEKLKLQKEEVEYVEWMSMEKIDKLVEKGEFLVSHRTCLEQCIEFLNDIRISED